MRINHKVIRPAHLLWRFLTVTDQKKDRLRTFYSGYWELNKRMKADGLQIAKDGNGPR